jgi:hypothetical protein
VQLLTTPTAASAAVTPSRSAGLNPAGGTAELTKQLLNGKIYLAPFPGQKSDKVASSRYRLIGV